MTKKGDLMIPHDHSPEDHQPRSDLGASARSDQTSLDHDETCSARDQDAADRDQAASDQDQAASDDEFARGRGRDGYDSSRATRDRATQARQATSSERHHTAQLRDETARVRQLAADDPPRSASQRAEAARDRAEATRDRLSAAQDRARTATEGEDRRLRESTDAYRRRAGLVAVEREINRARRQKGLLVVAYVDFDHRQASNEIEDQDAGDERVKHLVGVIRAHLRPDELIIRLGGGEFLCALPGATIETLGGRVEELAGQLTTSPYDSRVNIGVAELVLHDNAIDLVKRAHAHADLLAVDGEDRFEQQQRID
jgi:diguanylate cyclase (GGDEF)-like protein